MSGGQRDAVTPEASIARIRQLEGEVTRARREVELLRSIGRLAAADAAESIDHLRRTTEMQAGKIERVQRSLESVQRSLESLSSMPVVRLERATRRVSARFRRVRALVRRDRGTGGPARGAEDRLVRKLVAQSGPTPADRGPHVSIVMLNRDGAALLRRCLPALARTAYRDAEFVLVDNASTDDSIAIVEAAGLPYPIRLVRNATNLSFSDANNAGVAASSGELILLLNNDIEPVVPGWLGRMVETLVETDAAAVGARLIYPGRPVGGGRWTSPPLSLQHGGIAFRLTEGGYLPVPVGAGTDPTTEAAAGTHDAPALTAACLLLRRSAFDTVGGFTTGYDYGLEDVDLCLKLQACGGRLVYEGRAALWHHESATRGAEVRNVRVARVRGNRTRFAGTWGPRLLRTIVADALDGGTWLVDGPRVHVLGRIPRDLAAQSAVEALEAEGWTLIDDPAHADIEVVTDPRAAADAIARGPVLVAWIAGDEAAWAASEWLPDADIVLVADGEDVTELTARLGAVPTMVTGPAVRPIRAALGAWLATPHVAIELEDEAWDRARLGGDLPFARDLQRALRRRGLAVRVRLRPEWEEPLAGREDATIALMGRASHPTRISQVNVLWQISHPDPRIADDYRRFDLVFTASRPFATYVSGVTGRSVGVLLQATEPARFKPGRPGPRHELLFVANSRRGGRHLIADLLPTEHELAVYGARWVRDGLDPRYLAGDHVANDDLAGYYGSALIVFNDHWADMRREAILSNRLFDASAAGAFVISDDIETLDEVFDGGVVRYRDAEDLRHLVDRFLAAPEERAAHVARARAAVLAAHTFDHRAATLVSAMEPLLAASPSTVLDPPPLRVAPGAAQS